MPGSKHSPASLAPGSDLKCWDALPRKGDNLRENVFQIQPGPISDQLPDFVNVRHPARHIFKTFFVSTVIRNVDDLGLAARHLLDQVSELVHCDLFGVADVEYLTNRTGMLG